MQWPLLHRNHPSGQVFDAERYNIMNNEWFCVYLLILIVLVIDLTTIFHHGVMHISVRFVKIYLAFIGQLSHGEDLISRAH